MISRTNKTKFYLRFKDERGVTLLLSVLVLAVVLAIALSLASVSLVEIRSSGDLVRTEPTYYGADALSEEVFFKLKRSVPDNQFTYDSQINNVKLNSPSPVVSHQNNPIFQVRVNKFENTFQGTKQHFPIFDLDCPSPSTDSTLLGAKPYCAYGGSGYTRLKVSYLDTGNQDQMLVYLCEIDPTKPIDTTGGTPGAYQTPPCSSTADTSYWYAGIPSATLINSTNPTVDWVSLNQNMQYELILVNHTNESNTDMYAQIESFDLNGVRKGLPLVGSTAVDISASSAGVTRKIRTIVPGNSMVTQPDPLSLYTHHRDITLQASQVQGSDQTDFPVLISWTDNTMRSSAFGGRIQNPNGYDIVFTDSSNNLLSFEKQSYDGSAGRILFWVKVPLLSHSSNTVIKMWYSNSSVSSDPSDPPATWSNSFAAVWHMEDNAANTSVKDSANIANGTAARNTSLLTTSNAQIGSALTFNGSGDNVAYSPVTLGTTYTICVWTSIDFTNSYGTFAASNNANTIVHQGNQLIDWVSNGAMLQQVRTGYPFNPWPSNSWFHLCFVRNGTSVSFYKDGVLDSVNGSLGNNASFSPSRLGRDSDGINALKGSLDEVEFSALVRSSDWIKTQFNNQALPANFFSVGAEQ